MGSKTIWSDRLHSRSSCSIDPLPCVGKVIGLDGVPEALDATRRSEGPPRVVVHPDR